MASLRKTSCYSKMKVVPFTRWSRRKQKAFIKMIPAQKIVKFSMGRGGDYNLGKLPHVLTLVCAENCQIQVRHTALEACRQYLNKQMNEGAPGQFFLKVVPFPHHIQRENKMLTGAGADRMQTGMALSFGKSIAKAALLKKNSPIYMIALANEKSIPVARRAMKQIRAKLPCKISILYNNLDKEKAEKLAAKNKAIAKAKADGKEPKKVVKEVKKAVKKAPAKK